MFLFILSFYLLKFHITKGDISQDDVGYLNELPLDKLLRLKNSLQVLVNSNYDNVTSTSTALPATLDLWVGNFGAQGLELQSPVDTRELTSPVKRVNEQVDNFGAQALGLKFPMDREELNSPTKRGDEQLDHFGAQGLGLKSPVDRGDFKSPIKRGDEWEGLTKKGDYGKMSNIFSMAVTVLAFLAFGGYLLCLIVQAIRSKQNYNQIMATTVAPTTVFLNSGIKKRPHAHFASSSYGRRKRDVGTDMDMPPEQLFTALLNLCEGYVKWGKRYSG